MSLSLTVVEENGVTLASDETVTLTVSQQGPQGPAGASGGGGVTDHGALTGLADDDHQQYGTVGPLLVVDSAVTLSGLPRSVVVVPGGGVTMPATGVEGRIWTISNLTGSALTINGGTLGFSSGATYSVPASAVADIVLADGTALGGGNNWSVKALYPLSPALPVDASAISAATTPITNRLNRYYPSSPVVPHLHVSKYVTPDPDFPLDGTATHVGGQAIDAGQNLTILSDDSGNGGVWTMSLTGAATRATGFGAMVSSDIGNYDHVSYTGTRWAYFQLFRLMGDPVNIGLAPATGVGGITGGRGVSKSYKADLIANSVAGDVFTVLEADNSTTSVDASADLTGLGVLCVLVLSDLTLRTINNSGVVVQVEDFSRAEGRWTATGVGGDGVGTTVAITDNGTYAVLTIAAHKASHATGGGDALAPSDIGAVPTTRTINGLDLSANRTLSASDVSAVPTTRTINGLDLSANRTLTAADVGAAATSHTHAAADITSGTMATARLASTGTADATTFLRGDQTWAAPTATASGTAGGDLTGTYPNPTIASAAVTSSKVSGGLARVQVVAASKIADVTSTSVYVGSALVPPVGATTGSTLALALGTVYLARAQHDGATLNRLVFVVTASSLSAGQSVTIAAFNDSGGTPSTRAWSQSVTVGASTGAFITSSLSLAMPTGPCWIAVLNPSGNAGTVTLRSHQVMGAFLTVANDNNHAVVALESQASMPSDLSSNTLRTTTSGSSFAVGNAGATFPKIIANAS